MGLSGKKPSLKAVLCPHTLGRLQQEVRVGEEVIPTFWGS